VSRHAQVGGAQAGIGGIGLVLGIAGGTHGPQGIRGRGKQPGQARVVAIVEAEGFGHGLPCKRRQLQAATLGMGDEALGTRLQPGGKFGWCIDPRVVAPAGLQADAQVGAGEDRRPGGGLGDPQQAVVVAPYQLDRGGDPLQ